MDETQLMETENDSSQLGKRLLRVAKRGRWFIALTSLFAVVATTAVLSVMPSKYKSQATILIVEQEISSTLVSPLSTVPVGQRLQAMEWEVLSRGRLLSIINEYGLYADRKNLSADAAVDLMRDNIDVEPVDPKQDQFSAFTVAFTADNPQLAQNVTRTLASIFIERNIETQTNRARTTTDFFDEQLSDKRRKLADLDARMRDFKTQHFGELPDDRTVNEDRRREAQTQLDAAVANLSRARRQGAVWESTITQELNARLNRVRTERATLLKNFTPQHPDVLAKDEQIAQIEAELQWVKAGAPPTQKPRSVLSDSGIATLEGQLQSNALEVESLTSEQSRLTASMAEYERRLNATPAREQTLAGMVRESEELNSDMAEILKKQQSTGMSVDMESRQQGQQFKPLDPPSLPLRPWSPPRLKAALGAAAGGALLGLVFAFLWDLKSSTFHSEDELRVRFAPPLLLSIPVVMTPKEERVRAWKTGFEVVAGTIVGFAILAVELYVFRHP